MDEFEKRALDNIEKYGCHIINVLEDDLPGFCYSIGIQKTLGMPELVVVGLKPELAQVIINDYCLRLKNGESFLPGHFYADFIEGFEVYAIDVARKHYPEYFGWGNWLYSHWDFKVLQFVWPATEGVWPWDDNRSEFYEWAQPVLNESGALDKPSV